MSAILVADIHVNERPRDQYRWGLFDWLAPQKADELLIAGDLTDAKDRHGAQLVNRLHDAVNKLGVKFRVIIVKGNHDYLDPSHPFFQFLGSSLDVQFVVEPVEIELSIGSAFFVPAGAQWDFKIPEVDYLFTHATFSGAKAENGQLMTGVDSSVLSGFAGKCYSGDIHVPQVMAGGKIEYVGAPYHIRFGDAFVPRVLCIENSGKTRDLHFPAPSKHTFIIARPDDLRDEEAKAGDHVKVRCLLRRSEYDKWRGYAAEIKRIAEERSWLLFGAEPVALEMSEQARAEAEDGRALSTDDVLAAYVRQQKASDDYLVAGRLLLSGG